MGTCWSPTPIPDAHVHGSTVNPPATWIPTEPWPQSVEVQVGTSRRAGQGLFLTPSPSALHLCASETRAASGAGLTLT